MTISRVACRCFWVCFPGARELWRTGWQQASQLCALSGVSICTFVLVKHVNWVPIACAASSCSSLLERLSVCSVSFRCSRRQRISTPMSPVVCVCVCVCVCVEKMDDRVRVCSLKTNSIAETNSATASKLASSHKAASNLEPYQQLRYRHQTCNLMRHQVRKRHET